MTSVPDRYEAINDHDPCRRSLMWWLRHQCVGKTKSASETAVRLAFEKHFSDVAVNYRIRVIWRGVHSSKATEVVLDEISAVDKLGRLAR